MRIHANGSAVCLLAAAVVMVQVLLPADASAGEHIRWMSYRQGMHMAKDLNRPVMVYFFAEWCAFCKKMATDTFTDPQVIRQINDHFVAIRINTDIQRDIAREYRIQPLPDTWFLNGRGEKIGNREGYVPPATLLKILGYVRAENR